MITRNLEVHFLDDELYTFQDVSDPRPIQTTAPIPETAKFGDSEPMINHGYPPHYGGLSVALPEHDPFGGKLCTLKVIYKDNDVTEFPKCMNFKYSTIHLTFTQECDNCDRVVTIPWEVIFTIERHYEHPKEVYPEV